MSGSYTVCLPDYENILPKLSEIMGFDYGGGSFSKFEDAFVESQDDERLFKIVGKGNASLEVILERYEGYFFGTLRGSGAPFKEAKEYLWDCYIKSGGNPEAQQKP